IAMAGYVEGQLAQDERVIHKGHISLWILSPHIILGILLVPLFGVGLIFLVIAFIKYKSTELAVTNKRIVAKFGFISRRSIELNLSKIEGITVDQGVLGRIFNYGSLVVSGTGSLQ